MKYFLCLLALISFNTFSQDVIIKKSGEKIEAKVMEITSTTIKYKAHNQPDGPVRNVAINEVQEIIYEDGTWEKFDKPRTETEPVEEEPMRPTTPRPAPEEDKDPILESGFFLEGIIGPTFRHGYNTIETGYYDQFGNYIYQTSTVQTNEIFASINFRIGTKWYFGSGEKWRPGLQVNYLRFGFLINDDIVESLILGPKNFTICNVGMSNAFKFTDKIGMEANLTGGYNLEFHIDEGMLTHGVAVTPELKFRYNRFAVGIDYMHIFGLAVDEDFGGSSSDRPASADVVGVSVGVKF